MTDEHTPHARRTARVIDAPPSVVWDLLVSFDAWPRWGPSVTSVDAPGTHLGAAARGSVGTIVGLRLPFEVTAFDPGRYWAWKVAGVEATDHLLEPLSGDSCRLSFGVPGPLLPYLAVCRVALGRIDRMAHDVDGRTAAGDTADGASGRTGATPR